VKRNQLTHPRSVEYKNTTKQMMTGVIKDCPTIGTVALSQEKTKNKQKQKHNRQKTQ